LGGKFGLGIPEGYDDWTHENNLWIDALDNQVDPAPSTAPTVTFQVENDDTPRPTFTVSVKDGATPMNGSVNILRNGVPRWALPLVDGEVEFTPPMDVPSGVWT